MELRCNYSAKDIESIVSEVLKKLVVPANGGAATTASGDARGDWGVFERLEDAVAAAAAAYKRLDTVALRERVVEIIRRAARANARRLAEMAVDETGMGRIEDKVRKNLLVADRTPGPESLYPSAMSGRPPGLTLVENAPWGVIASVTPSTNPAATVINNAISMLSGGNAVVFAPHPSAKRVTQEAIRILNKAISEEVGITQPDDLRAPAQHRDCAAALHLPGHPAAGRDRRRSRGGGRAQVDQPSG